MVMATINDSDPTLDLINSFNDPDRWVVVKNAPIFKAHTRTTKGGDGNPKQIVVTEQDLPVIAGQINEKLVTDGTPALITIGHRQQSNPAFPETMQPPVVGYALNARVGTFGPTQQTAILADMYFKKEDWSEARKHPFRSIDFYPETGKASAVAVLTRDPFLGLGAISYQAEPVRIQTQPVRSPKGGCKVGGFFYPENWYLPPQVAAQYLAEQHPETYAAPTPYISNRLANAAYNERIERTLMKTMAQPKRMLGVGLKAAQAARTPTDVGKFKAAGMAMASHGKFEDIAERRLAQPRRNPAAEAAATADNLATQQNWLDSLKNPPQPIDAVAAPAGAPITAPPHMVNLDTATQQTQRNRVMPKTGPMQQPVHVGLTQSQSGAKPTPYAGIASLGAKVLPAKVLGAKVLGGMKSFGASLPSRGLQGLKEGAMWGGLGAATGAAVPAVMGADEDSIKSGAIAGGIGGGIQGGLMGGLRRPPVTSASPKQPAQYAGPVPASISPTASQVASLNLEAPTVPPLTLGDKAFGAAKSAAGAVGGAAKSGVNKFRSAITPAPGDGRLGTAMKSAALGGVAGAGAGAIKGVFDDDSDPFTEASRMGAIGAGVGAAVGGLRGARPMPTPAPMVKPINTTAPSGTPVVTGRRIAPPMSSGTPAPEDGTGIINPKPSNVPGIVSGAKEIPLKPGSGAPTYDQHRFMDKMRRMGVSGDNAVKIAGQLHAGGHMSKADHDAIVNLLAPEVVPAQSGSQPAQYGLGGMAKKAAIGAGIIGGGMAIPAVRDNHPIAHVVRAAKNPSGLIQDVRSGLQQTGAKLNGALTHSSQAKPAQYFAPLVASIAAPIAGELIAPHVADMVNGTPKPATPKPAAPKTPSMKPMTMQAGKAAAPYSLGDYAGRVAKAAVRGTGDTVEQLFNVSGNKDYQDDSAILQNGVAPVEYRTQHAPAGGADVGGKHFTGGEFITDADLAKATPEEKKKLQDGNKGVGPQTKIGKAVAAVKKPFAAAKEGVRELSGKPKPIGSLIHPDLKATVSNFIADAPESERQALMGHLNQTLTGKVGQYISKATPEELHELQRHLVMNMPQRGDAKAPPNGFTIPDVNGKPVFFKGGSNVPAGFLKRATPEQMKQIKGPGFIEAAGSGVQRGLNVINPLNWLGSSKQKAEKELMSRFPAKKATALAAFLATLVGLAYVTKGARKGMSAPPGSPGGSSPTPPPSGGNSPKTPASPNGSEGPPPRVSEPGNGGGGDLKALLARITGGEAPRDKMPGPVQRLTPRPGQAAPETPVAPQKIGTQPAATQTAVASAPPPSPAPEGAWSQSGGMTGPSESAAGAFAPRGAVAQRRAAGMFAPRGRQAGATSTPPLPPPVEMPARPRVGALYPERFFPEGSSAMIHGFQNDAVPATYSLLGSYVHPTTEQVKMAAQNALKIGPRKRSERPFAGLIAYAATNS